MIEFNCSNCQMHIRVKDDSAGKTGKCPKCKSIIKVPTVSLTGVQPGVAAETASEKALPEQASASPVEAGTKEKAAPNMKHIGSATYVTGPWDIKPNEFGMIRCGGGNLTFTIGIFSKKTFTIPLQAIKKTTIDTMDRLPRVTLTRVMLVGVFALAWKKGKRDKFLQIDFADDTNSDVSLVFGKGPGLFDSIDSLQSGILAARHDYLKSVLGKSQDASLPASNILAVAGALRGAKGPAAVLPAPSKVETMGAQLEELAALRDKGLLTPEEFQAKKTELLARI